MKNPCPVRRQGTQCDMRLHLPKPALTEALLFNYTATTLAKSILQLGIIRRFAGERVEKLFPISVRHRFRDAIIFRPA